MSLESGRPVVGDPVALRALAHPVRLKLHTLIGRAGPLTAAEAARELGISQALASHHLRQLAKYGYVEPAPADDNRERPWRLTHTSFAFAPGLPREALEPLLLERCAARLTEWHQGRDDEDPRWAELGGVAPSLVYLTPDEMAEFVRAFEALIRPLVDRRPLGDAASRPPDARPVDITLLAVPLPPTATGG